MGFFVSVTPGWDGVVVSVSGGMVLMCLWWCCVFCSCSYGVDVFSVEVSLLYFRCLEVWY